MKLIHYGLTELFGFVRMYVAACLQQNRSTDIHTEQIHWHTFPHTSSMSGPASYSPLTNRGGGWGWGWGWLKTSHWYSYHHSIHIYMCMHTHTHVCISTHTHTHTHHIHTHKPAQTHTHCTHTCISTYTHTYTHMHTHTHTHPMGPWNYRLWHKINGEMNSRCKSAHQRREYATIPICTLHPVVPTVFTQKGFFRFEFKLLSAKIWNGTRPRSLVWCTSGGVCVPCIYMHARWELP